MLSILVLALPAGFATIINLLVYFGKQAGGTSEISKILLHVGKSKRVRVPIRVIRLRVKIRIFINAASACHDP